MEREAKLAITSRATLLRLQDPATWREYGPRHFLREDFEALYLDGAQGELAALMASFRLRREGARLMLTVKWPPSAAEQSALPPDDAARGIKLRGEFNLRLPEQAAPAAGPALCDAGPEWEGRVSAWRRALLENAEAHRCIPPPVLAALRAARLTRRYAAVFTRCHAELRFEGARVELAVDSGFLRAGTREEPLAELELEALDGPPDALSRLTERVSEGFGLRPLTASKYARLLALGRGLYGSGEDEKE